MEHNRLPDTPWHIGYVKKEEDDPIRHKARCVHIDSKKVCKCPKSGCYLRKCGGSSHCKFYAETMAQWESVWKQIRTAEDEAEERIQKWAASRRKKFRETQYKTMQYAAAKSIRKCPICEESVSYRKGGYSICSNCKTYFIDEQGYVQCMQILRVDPEVVFVTNRARVWTDADRKTVKEKAKGNTVNDTSVPPKKLASFACRYADGHNRCQMEECKKYQKACRKETCTFYKPIQLGKREGRT